MHRRNVKILLGLVAALFLAFGGDRARALEISTPAREAVLIDFKTGAVLFAKNPDKRMPPASMSKIMTMYLLFEQIKSGNISLDDKFTVSPRAWRKGGSKMFVEVNSRVRVEDLVRGVIVQSGNDAAIVVAEGISGTEADFARRMSEKARELGMRGSHFANATGWPDPGQHMTARDLARLARRMIMDFPDFYHYYREKEFTYNNIRQNNRNPLLYKSLGADGLKTGHTEEAGYGLTASAVRGDRRLILVVNGLSSARERSVEAERLLKWGFSEFDNFSLFRRGEEVVKADVWLGTRDRVGLVADRDIVVTLPRNARRNMTVKAVFAEPIPAPFNAGDQIAKLVISGRDISPPLELPLVAGQGAEMVGPVRRIFSAVEYMVLGASDDR